MKNVLTKYRTRIILFSTILLVILGSLQIYFVFNITAKTNDECLWKTIKVSEDSTKIIFDNVKVNGITWNAGIRNGDEFLKIGKKKLRSIYQATYLADSKNTGDSLTYTYLRNGEIFVTKLPVKKLIEFGDLAIILLGLIWLAVGFIVVSSKPYGKTQNLFYKIGAYFVLFSSLALFKGNNNLNPVLQNNMLMLVLDLAWIFGSIFVSFGLVEFFLIFPRETSFSKKKIFNTIFTTLPWILFVLAIIFRALFLYYPKSQHENISKYNTYLISLLGIAFLASLVIGLILLIVNYIKLKKTEDKKPIFIVVIFYILAVLSIAYIMIVANVLAGGSQFNTPEYFLPIFLITLLPLGFGYSIFKYSLMDVSDVLKNTIMYGTATFSLAGAYFLLMYLLGQTISEAITEEYQGVVAALIFIMFAFVFQSTKDKFQKIITKSFYPEQFAYQQVLMKFSNDVATIVGLENILDSVQSTFMEGLKVNKFGIALKNNNDNQFTLKRENGFYNKHLIFENKNNSIQQAVESKIKLNLPITFDNNEFKEICPTKIKHLDVEKIYTIVPLVIKQKVIGLLLFGLKHSGAQFAGKDIELLIAAANQTAVSIENARLYEAEATKIKLERDLDVAREIQESMLPKEIPQIKGIDIAGTMIPAMQVGGDYFDIIKVSDRQVYIVVGDVSGKGLSASFYMSKLQTMIHLFCNGGKSPKEILTEVNQKLSGNIEKKWFITLTIALIDLKDKSIIISRAGHTPTLQYTEHNVKFIQPKGLGVGLEFSELFSNSLEEVKFSLKENEIFFFTSDGVSEAMNNNNDLFGDERVALLLKENYDKSSQEIIDTTISSLEKFRGSKEPNDDITIVVLKITE